MLHQPTYAPAPMLAADVNCFWALEQDQESYNREVYLPDAYIEVIINATQCHLSSSQLERQFKHYTAISPKAYARIVRFGSLQASLLVNPAIRLVDLADVYGYSDQAHLIREFKSFADCTPRDFAASAPAYFELRQNED